MPQLEDLVIDPDQIDHAVLAEGLAGIVGVTHAGTPYPLERWEELNERGKVVAALLAAKAAAVLGRRTAATLTPAEVTKVTGVAGGTVRRELRSLAEARVAWVTEKSGYSIPGVMLRRALREMKEGRPRRG